MSHFIRAKTQRLYNETKLKTICVNLNERFSPMLLFSSSHLYETSLTLNERDSDTKKIRKINEKI